METRIKSAIITDQLLPQPDQPYHQINLRQAIGNVGIISILETTSYNLYHNQTAPFSPRPILPIPFSLAPTTPPPPHHMSLPKAAKEVYTFWFEKSIQNKGSPDMRWFQKNADFDLELATKFGSLVTSASKCELASWRTTPQGRLAEIILLDQFSRNIYRGTAQSFSQDNMALTLAQEAVYTHQLLPQLDTWERMFMLLPFMHSESKLVQEESLRLFSDPNLGVPTSVDFALKHKAIIDRFGRYPHRNEALGRVSTAEEIEFLAGPDSSF